MKIQINKKRFIIILLMLASLNLSSYDHMGRIISVINNPLRALAVVGAGFMIIRKRKIQFTPIFWILLLMEFELLVSTLINNGSLWTWFATACGLFAFLLIFEAWSHDIKELIFALMPVMELLCYGNYLTILLFPHGLYVWQTDAGWITSFNWLLGYRTGFIAYLLPACVIAFLYRQYGGKRWREWGVYIVSFIMVALPPSRSATSAIGLTAFFLMLFFARKGIRFNVYLLAAINIAFFFIVVVFRLHEAFLGLIGSVFSKNIVTLSGRTPLWDNLLQLIKEKPLIGYGVQSLTGSVALLKFNYGANAHNIILHYLYQGGAIQLTLYLCLMATVYRHLRKAHDQVTAQVISAALFVFQIVGLTETLQGPFLCILYYFGFFAEQISADTVMTSEIVIKHKAALKRRLVFSNIHAEKKYAMNKTDAEIKISRTTSLVQPFGNRLLSLNIIGWHKH